MNAREVLLSAADLLDRDGWQRDALGPTSLDIHAPRCVMGAIDAVAAGDDDDLLDAYELLWTAPEVRNIAAWNNASERTEGEVIATLRRIATAQP